MSNPLLSKLDDLDGVALKERFAEARRAAIEAGAQVEADAATRLLYQIIRTGIRSMVKGIDARAAASEPAAAVTIPDPRPRAPMKPIPSPRSPVPAPAKASAPAPKPAVPKPRWTPPPPPVPPPIDPDDDLIPF